MKSPLCARLPEQLRGDAEGADATPWFWVTPRGMDGDKLKVEDMSVKAADRQIIRVDPSDVLVSPFGKGGSKVDFAVGEVVLAKWVGTATAFYPAEIVSLLCTRGTNHVLVRFDGDEAATTREVHQLHIVRELKASADLRPECLADELLDSLAAADGDEDSSDDDEVSPPDDADTSDAELPAVPLLGRRASPSPRKAATRRAAPKPSPQGSRLPPAPKRGRGSGSPAAPARPGSSASTLTLRPRGGLRSDTNGRAIHDRPFR